MLETDKAEGQMLAVQVAGGEVEPLETMEHLVELVGLGLEVGPGLLLLAMVLLDLKVLSSFLLRLEIY